MSVLRIEAVDLVEVDPVGAQPPQRVLDRPHDPAARVAPLVGVLTHRVVELRGEDHVVAPAAGERLADDLLGLALAIDVGRVDEVDPGVERRVDDPDRLVVVGVAPRAEHHRAKTELADRHAGATQLTMLHSLPPFRRRVLSPTHCPLTPRRRLARVCSAHLLPLPGLSLSPGCGRPHGRLPDARWGRHASVWPSARQTPARYDEQACGSSLRLLDSVLASWASA